MQNVVNFFKKKGYLLIFALILAVAIFFRTYQIVERYGYAHDAELFSWIVKDIVVNQHPRLIGQLTSAPGIFIGPLYYYLLVPFFLLFNMDPIGAIIPITIFGILTVISYYFVFSKLFNEKVGLIASFIYAVSFYTVDFDRKVVPSTPTNLWIIWYLYGVVMLSRGQFRILPILGILIGLIWHIHIALAPTLIVIPIALYFAKKMPTKKQILIFLLITFLSSLPLIIFESRHNFLQTKSLIGNFAASFATDSYISENRKVVFGKENDNARLNLSSSSKFLLEVEPKNPNIGDKINLKITTKNPKYSTLVIQTDCGEPEKYEIGSITAELVWSTTDCRGETHEIIATARLPTISSWKIALAKFIDVVDKENTNIQRLFIFPFEFTKKLQIIVTIIILLTPFITWRLRLLPKSHFLIYYGWLLAVFLFFTISSIIVSEYYLASTTVILILPISLILYRIYKLNNFGKYFVLLLILIFFITNYIYFVTLEEYKKGYLEKKNVVQFITDDAKMNKFPCIGINYITTLGENVGFRYLLYLNKIHTVKPSFNVPVYDIVIPDELALEKVEKKFGHIGVILPKAIPSKEITEETCKGENTNLTDPLFGYVE